MLISPLMAPIIGLGFALATFDWPEVRRSLVALVAGTLLAVRRMREQPGLRRGLDLLIN